MHLPDLTVRNTASSWAAPMGSEKWHYGADPCRVARASMLRGPEDYPVPVLHLEYIATMPETIISGMDKPDYVVGGVMRCGNCGTPLRLGFDGWAPCNNPECIRNKLATSKSGK
jgi:hypothetical protein